MVKFKVQTESGRTLVGLGITEGNLKKLKEGFPLVVNGEELQIGKIDFTIFYGKTERAIFDELQKGKLLPPDMKFEDYMRGNNENH
jgi:hypothetical protein